MQGGLLQRRRRDTTVSVRAELHFWCDTPPHTTTAASVSRGWRVVTVDPAEAVVSLLLCQDPGRRFKAGLLQEAGPRRSNSAASRSVLPSFASVPGRIPSPGPTFASAAPPNPRVANLSPPKLKRGLLAAPLHLAVGRPSREASPRSSWARPTSGGRGAGVVGRGGCRWCSGREDCRPG